MNDRMQLLEDLDVLVRMCRSKNDGASLVIEEEEINQKISELTLEIDELKSSAEEENYDTSAEMADRNIEIITKKDIISTLFYDIIKKVYELHYSSSYFILQSIGVIYHTHMENELYYPGNYYIRFKTNSIRVTFSSNLYKNIH